MATLDESIFIAAPREIEIKAPRTKEGAGIFFTLRPDSDDEVKKVNRQILDEALAAAPEGLTDRQKADQDYRAIRARVAAWRYPEGFKLKGKLCTGSEANLKYLLSIDEVLNQVVAEVRKRADFFPA